MSERPVLTKGLHRDHGAPRPPGHEHRGQPAPRRARARERKIGAVVHTLGNRLPLAQGLQGRLLLGSHPARRSAQPVGWPLAGLDRLASQVKIEKHGQSVTRDQEIRRFHVHMNQTARVRLMQGVGQTGDDPADRLNVGGLGQVTTVGAFVSTGKGRVLTAVNSIKKMASRA